MFHIALYQPHIPHNVGAIIRLCANLGYQLHLIRPFGFIWSQQKIKAASLGYFHKVEIQIHTDIFSFWQNFVDSRVILVSTKGENRYDKHNYQKGDCLLFGNENIGLPPEIHTHPNIFSRITIPMAKHGRSLNLATSVAIIGYEAWRQNDFAPEV